MQTLGVRTNFKEKKWKPWACIQLGGACDKEFQAKSFEEIAELSKQHGTEMFQKKDETHLKAKDKMQELMQEGFYPTISDTYENALNNFSILEIRDFTSNLSDADSIQMANLFADQLYSEVI